MNRFTTKWFKAALIRALRTIAQTMVSMITVGQAFGEINWANVVSVSVVAGLCSLLTSVATGLPESQEDGELIVDESGENSDIFTLSANSDPGFWPDKKTVNFTVVKKKSE